MSEEEALLAAVYANPDDDTPRLVYADWLDEHGDAERAEFIRLQIERARTTPPGVPAGRSSRKMRAEKSAREDALLKRHAQAWFQPPAGWTYFQHYTVRRGFPYAVACGSEPFLALQDVLTRWPITRLNAGMWLQNAGYAHRLAELHLLARTRELNAYYSHAGLEGLRVLLESPFLAGLLWLNVACCRLGDAGAEFLARRPVLPRLRYLDLNANDITSSGVRALIESEHRGAVESLSLANSPVTADDARELLQSEYWTGLTDLCLWNSRFRDDAVAALAACPALSRLTALNLNHNRITDDGVRALAASPHVRNLRTLSLATNALTSASADVLIDSSNLRELKYLRLANNKIQWRKRRKLEQHFGAGVSFDLM
jgi:uncharacterized protein (TIGR02996 family)